MAVNESFKTEESDPDAIVVSKNSSEQHKEKNNAKVSTGLKEEKKEKDDEKKDGEEEEKIDPIPIKQMFRYATTWEITLMSFGILAALFGGLCMPAMIILFGRLTNAFVYEDMNITMINNTYNLTEEEIMDMIGGDFDFNKEMRIFGIGTAIFGLIQMITGYIFVTTLNYAAEGQVFRIRGMLLKSTLKQEIGWFDVKQTNDFASKIAEDTNKIQDGIGEKVGMFVFFMTTFFFSLINAFVHGWELTLVILCVFPVLGIAMTFLAKVSTSLASNELKKYAKAGSIAEEVLSSIRTVLAFGGEKKEVERYEKELIHAKTAGIKRGLMTGINLGVMFFTIYASYALAFWYGTKLILESRLPGSNKNFDPNDLIVVFFSVLMGAMNVGQTAPYIEAFNIARGAAASVYSIIERQSEIDPTSPLGEKPDKVTGTVEFKDVHFSYPSRPKVKILQSMNIRINPGESVALVGSSGCGKSTCVQLIQRFYDPNSGSVTLDGKDLRTLNIGWLRDHIGSVGQEPVLFATTIAENIRYGRESATFDEIQEAAKEANAHNFIMSLPKNYNTQVGDRGVQMSGGQKQRIAIARALVKQPRVLLLDEATSALDNESEAIVQRALDKVRKGRTTIIVAHRLTTIKSADLIVAMKGGKVVETGTHKELMNKNGYYRSLVTAQLSHRDNEKEKEDSSGEEDSEFDSKEIVEDIIDEFTSKNPLPFVRSSSVRYSEKRKRRSVISSSSRRSSKSSSKKKKNDDDDSDIEIAPIKDILKLNSPEWYYIVGGVLGATIQGCVMPVYAILFGDVLGTLSELDPDKAKKQANFYSLLFVVVGTFASLAMFFQAYMFSLSGECLTMRLRKRAFQTMLKQEMGWFDEDKNSTGSLCSRLSGDASAVQGATGSRVGAVIQSITTLIFCITLAMYYDARLGAVTLPFIPLVLVSVYIQTKLIMGQSLTEMKVLEDAGKIAIEAITNIRTVASLHREEKLASVYTQALLEPHLSALKKSHVRGIAFGFAQAVPFFAYAAVIFYGGHLVEKDEIEYEEVFKVSEALILGTMMVGQAMAFAPNYGKAKIAASKLIALFNRTPAIDTSENYGYKMTQALKRLTFKNVEFAYPTRSTLPILKGLSLEVINGKKVALVGSSGCGKSTIISLLERFYNTKGGSVLLNDSEIQELNVGYVRSLFGLVSQEPVLFDRTISENISYGNNTRTFSQKDIEEVARQANIHDFVKSLPDGYETRVGSKGTQLSGGQKQRIAIARALLRNPEVLLLDEATSALDAESELIVQETLEEVQKDRTSIVIAHRLSTIRGVDKILVLDGGVIVEEGTHEELLAKRGHYWQLYNTSV